MNISFREYKNDDVELLKDLWNDILTDGVAFPDFKGMQFNAVVLSNTAAILIYQSVGLQIVGTIPNGFLLKNGTYSDMYIMYLPFTE